MTGILNLSEAMIGGLYGELSSRQVRTIEMIEHSGRHLLELINDILDLSKIEAGEARVETPPCAFAELVDASLLFVRSAAERKRIHTAVSLSPHDLRLEVDPRRVKQVLINLLSNAVKFTPEGGRVGLEVERDRENERVRLTVWDTGIGIAQDDLPRLFEPFVQLDGGLDRRYEGTGLGLPLVRRLTEMLGRSVEVESTPGEGSRFHVYLPLREAVAGLSGQIQVEQDQLRRAHGPANGGACVARCGRRRRRPHGPARPDRCARRGAHGRRRGTANRRQTSRWWPRGERQRCGLSA